MNAVPASSLPHAYSIVSAQTSLTQTLSPTLAAPLVSGRGARAAREFEGQLIESLLENLEKTFATMPGKGSMPGADDYNYLGIETLAQALAAKGGFGIAAMITRDLARHEAPGEGK
jgi:hypothetical protein